MIFLCSLDSYDVKLWGAKTKWWPSESRKESALNCLLKEGQSLYTKMGPDNSGCIEEGKMLVAKANNRWEWKIIMAACLEWNTVRGNNKQ